MARTHAQVASNRATPAVQRFMMSHDSRTICGTKQPNTRHQRPRNNTTTLADKQTAAPTSMQRRKKLQCCKQAMLQTKQCCRHSSAAHKTANTTELQRNGAIKNEPIQTSHILAHSTITISVQQCAVQAAMHGRHKQCIGNANTRHVLGIGKTTVHHLTRQPFPQLALSPWKCPPSH